MPGTLNIAAYITINLLLFSSWYLVFFRKKDILSFPDRITGTFIFGLVQIIITAMLLGVVTGKLYAAPLFLLNCVISSAVFLYAVKAPLLQSEVSEKNRALPLSISVRREIAEKAVWFFGALKNDMLLLCLFVFFSLTFAWTIFLGYLFPSYTWDALWYHLPIAGYIMQSGAIQEVPNYSFIDQFINIFPKNIELYFLWNIIFLRSDIITDLSQLPFTLAGVFTIYSSAVKLNIRGRYALYAAFLFFFVPVIILQSSTNYVDIAVSVLFLISINFLLPDNNKMCRTGNAAGSATGQGRAQIVLAGLTAGILLGSKGSGPLFAVVLSAVVLIRGAYCSFDASHNIFSAAKNSMLRSLKIYLLFFFVPLILMGGYWYVKNWVVYGNPVYPMEISLFNITIFKGLYQGLIEPAPEIMNKLYPVLRPLYVWLDKVEYYLYDSRLGGFGPVWFVLFLPAIIFSVLHSIIRKNYRFIMVFAIVASAFLLHPRNWNPRYVIFLMGGGALSFGYVLEYFSERGRVLRLAAMALAVYTFFVSNSPCITPEQIRRFMNLPAKERTISALAPFNIDLHAKQEYGYWTWINRNIEQGETLAYTFEPLFLSPLWNSAFSSRIAYIKADAYEEWLNRLKERGTDYVLMRRHSGEEGWAANAAAEFTVAYSDENYKIVRLK